ncbi:MAG: hypothetical protein J5911_04200 [Clostridia bacterium]|nr:hypothetical protein [Clostridia bacterium]
MTYRNISIQIIGLPTTKIVGSYVCIVNHTLNVWFTIQRKRYPNQGSILDTFGGG